IAESSRRRSFSSFFFIPNQSARWFIQDKFERGFRMYRGQRKAFYKYRPVHASGKGKKPLGRLSALQKVLALFRPQVDDVMEENDQQNGGYHPLIILPVTFLHDYYCGAHQPGEPRAGQINLPARNSVHVINEHIRNKTDSYPDKREEDQGAKIEDRGSKIGDRTLV